MSHNYQGGGGYPSQGYQGQGQHADRDRPPHDHYARSTAPTYSYTAPAHDAVYGQYDPYPTQGYGHQPGPAGERWERGRDAGDNSAPSGYTSAYATDSYGGPSGSSRQREAPRRPQKPPSEESNHIIFLGLDPEMSDAALAEWLRNDHELNIESTTIIRDKTTGISKGFGFAAFSTVEEASKFLHANYPLVLVPPVHPHSEPRRAKIDFSGTNNSSSAAADPYSGPGARVSKLNDGTRDIGPGNDGNRVLLLRGLDVQTRGDEVVNRIGEEIDRLVGRDERHIGGLEGRRAVQRVVLISDERTQVGWGFGFIEFFHPELATSLLAHLQSPVSQPRGFVMHSAPHRPVASSFANPSSFAPIDPGAESTEGCIQASGPGGIGGGAFSGWCAYWDERALATETLGVKSNGQADELLAAHLAKLVPPPIFLGPPGAAPAVQQDLQKTGPISISTKGKKNDALEVGMIPIVEKRKANVLGDDDEEEDLVGKDYQLASRTKGVRMIPTMTTSKKIAKNISKWNTKQTELAKIPTSSKAPQKLSTANAALGAASKWNASSTIASSSTTPPPSAPAAVPVQAAAPAAIDATDYTDTSTLAFTGKVACLLCQRQFKTEDVLQKHVAQSDLHKARMTNLADPSICELGAKRKAAAVAAAADPDSAKKYRDRAAERRTVFHQSAAPGPEVPATRRREEPARPEPALEPAKDESNVGNQLLAKMGWKAGDGLGLEGDGRVAPVVAHQFENRAGLGASTGREAGKYSGAEGYRTMAKDLAKSRYESSESK